MTGVPASSNWKWAYSVRSVCSKWFALFQIAGKLQYAPIDNSFKQVQIAYLGVISNLDKLVQSCYMLPMQIRLLARPRAFLSL